MKYAQRQHASARMYDITDLPLPQPSIGAIARPPHLSHAPAAFDRRA
jgi:hypothetical protein